MPFREEDLWNGYPEETNAPYGLAKKMLLVQSQAYRQQYGFNSIFLLPVNLYGPGDNFDLRDLARHPGADPQVRRGQEARASAEVVLWGDGSPTREFLYVEDAAEGILLAAERYDDSEPVNLGSGREISIRDLAELIARLTGFAGRFVWDTSQAERAAAARPGHVAAEALFGFRARTSFEDGLRQTIDWYRANQDRLSAKGSGVTAPALESRPTPLPTVFLRPSRGLERAQPARAVASTASCSTS